MQLRMAALNQPYSGDLHGIRGADLQCHMQARKANLRGTFRAVLGSHVQNIDRLVSRHRLRKHGNQMFRFRFVVLPQHRGAQVRQAARRKHQGKRRRRRQLRAD